MAYWGDFPQLTLCLILNVSHRVNQSYTWLGNEIHIPLTLDFTHSSFSFYRGKCECSLTFHNCVLEFASCVETPELSMSESSGWASPWESHFVSLRKYFPLFIYYCVLFYISIPSVSPSYPLYPPFQSHSPFPKHRWVMYFRRNQQNLSSHWSRD